MSDNSLAMDSGRAQLVNSIPPLRRQRQGLTYQSSDLRFWNVQSSQLGLALVATSISALSKIILLMLLKCNNAAVTMTETTTQAKPRKLIPISQSISVLPTDTARIYNYIHPILILSLYYLYFPSLIADPVSTLKNSIAPLAHLQIIYCIVCLPPSKGSSTQSTPSTTPKKVVQFAKPAAKPPATLASRIIVSSL